jgi:hypothetical protein
LGGILQSLALLGRVSTRNGFAKMRVLAAHEVIRPTA